MKSIFYLILFLLFGLKAPAASEQPCTLLELPREILNLIFTRSELTDQNIRLLSKSFAKSVQEEPFRSTWIRLERPEHIQQYAVAFTKFDYPFPRAEIKSRISGNSIPPALLMACSTLQALTFDHSVNLTNLQSLEYFSYLISLSLNHTDVEDISMLMHCPKLQHLSLSVTKVKDLNPLISLLNLTILYACGCKLLTDVSPLAKCSRLVEVYLDDTPITTLDPLASIPNLKILSASTCRNLESISQLSKSLQKLCLNETKIKNLNALSMTPNLVFLYLEKCSYLKDILLIKTARKIRILSLAYSDVLEIDALRYLTLLESLDLRGMKITNLNSLSNLFKLRILYLLDCPFLSDITALGTCLSLETLYLSNELNLHIATLEHQQKLKIIYETVNL